MNLYQEITTAKNKDYEVLLKMINKDNLYVQLKVKIEHLYLQ